jgi:hypothetical protein
MRLKCRAWTVIPLRRRAPSLRLPHLKDRHRRRSRGVSRFGAWFAVILIIGALAVLLGLRLEHHQIVLQEGSFLRLFGSGLSVTLSTFCHRPIWRRQRAYLIKGRFPRENLGVFFDKTIEFVATRLLGYRASLGSLSGSGASGPNACCHSDLHDRPHPYDLLFLPRILWIILKISSHRRSKMGSEPERTAPDLDGTGFFMRGRSQGRRRSRTACHKLMTES